MPQPSKPMQSALDAVENMPSPTSTPANEEGGNRRRGSMTEPTSKFERAAQATVAVEQRIARVREILASFAATDINGHGFYTEPFAHQSALGRAAREIKAAVQIIGDTCWPDEDEAAAVRIDPQIGKLRDQCRAELHTMKLHFRDYEDLADASTDPQALTKLLRALTGFRQDLPSLRVNGALNLAALTVATKRRQ